MATGDGGCSNALCAVERRLIRKDLLGWAKKVPVLVGLETIAEALAGRGSVLLSQRTPSGFDVVPEDWSASQPCSVCLRTNSTEPEGLQDHRSWCGPHRDGALDVFSAGPEHRNLRDTYSAGSHGYDLELDTPLDLRRHPPLVADERSADVDCILGKSVTELKVPRIVQKATKQSVVQPAVYAVKKTYTDLELAAATSDICSGRIGTRRASTLYGIPRSTLRNKIFRLRSSDVSSFSSTSVDDFRDPVSGAGRLDAAFQRIDNIKSECCSIMDFDEQDAVMDALYDSRAAAAAAAAALVHCQGPYKTLVPPPPSKVAQGYFPEGEGEAVETLAKEWKGPFIERLIQEFTEKQMKAKIEQHRGLDYDGFRTSGGIYMDEGFGAAAAAPELKVPFYRSTDEGCDGASPPPPPPPPPLGGLCSGDWRWRGGCSELLTSMSRSNRINEMLKEIITRTIAEKLRSRRFDALFAPSDAAALGFTDVVGVVEATPPPTHRGPEDFESSPADSRSTSGGSSSDGERRQQRPGDEEEEELEEEEKGPTAAKKTRPKRGQYRKYNRQLLLEAVKAVQKGDMSVHRAGSYYGVPHSTLEYKVKERHLLRQRKGLENSSAARTTTEPPPPLAARSQGEANGSSSASRHPKTAALVFGGKKAPPAKETGLRPVPPPPPTIPPYSFRFSPIEDGLLSSAAAASSLASPGLPLPVNCFRGTLPIGFGWPPPPSALMAGLFSLPLAASVPPPPPPGSLFDAIQVPPPPPPPQTNFGGFSMSASDLLKRLQQKVQASLSGGGGGGHTVPRMDEESVLDPPPPPPGNGDRNNSGRSSASCGAGSPQVAVS